MKNLKIKFGLFSLLAVLAASVLLTSCEQENIDIIPNHEEVNDLQSQEFIFVLPENINKLSDEEINEFINGLSIEEIKELSVEIDSRASCGSWQYLNSSVQFIRSYYSGSQKYCVNKVSDHYRRWCTYGSPSNGGYQYRYFATYIHTPC